MKCDIQTFGNSHCGKRLFFVQKSHFTIESLIEVSDMARCRLSKNFGEFSKNTVAKY